MKKKIVEKKNNKNGLVIYQAKSGAIELRGDISKETIWATQAQIIKLFGIDQSVVSRHIKNVFKDKEIDLRSNMQKMHIANSDKPVILYSLDVILAVGYRTNSKTAIDFRRWATKTLKEYLVQGYVVNEKRLLEAKENFNKLQNTIAFLNEKSHKELLSGQGKEILDLLGSYAKTLTLLDEYDRGELSSAKGTKGKFVISYEHCLEVIIEVRNELANKGEASELFGCERDGSFGGIIKGLYQTFGGKELYSTLEIKAAHILYLIIKDHPFSDGNKRMGSFLFVYFLDKNNALYREHGEKKINDNALASLALLIAESDPNEKDQMIALITQLLK